MLVLPEDLALLIVDRLDAITLVHLTAAGKPIRDLVRMSVRNRLTNLEQRDEPSISHEIDLCKLARLGGMRVASNRFYMAVTHFIASAYGISIPPPIEIAAVELAFSTLFSLTPDKTWLIDDDGLWSTLATLKTWAEGSAPGCYYPHSRKWPDGSDFPHFKELMTCARDIQQHAERDDCPRRCPHCADGRYGTTPITKGFMAAAIDIVLGSMAKGCSATRSELDSCGGDDDSDDDWSESEADAEAAAADAEYDVTPAQVLAELEDPDDSDDGDYIWPSMLSPEELAARGHVCILDDSAHWDGLARELPEGIPRALPRRLV